MKKANWWILGLIGLVVLAGISILYLNNLGNEEKYLQEINSIWTLIVNENSNFDNETKACNDFSDIKGRCEAKSAVFNVHLGRLNQMGKEGIPAKFARFHESFIAAVNNNIAFYTATSKALAEWQKVDFENVGKAASDTRLAFSNCCNNWPVALYQKTSDDKLFVELAPYFKKLAKQKKTVSVASWPSSTGQIIGQTSQGILVVLPSIGSQFYYNPSADYMVTMRQLINQYKGLRGDLSYQIDTGTENYNRLTQAIASRRNIYNAMMGLSVPLGWQTNHQYALDTIQNGIWGIEALRNQGDRAELHRLSVINTERMKNLARMY